MTIELDKARKAALKILNDSNLLETAPIIPYEIVKNYGLQIVSAKFSDQYKDIVSGFLDFNQKKIFINGEESVPRKTFTIAHELGHWILHKEIIKENSSLYSVLMRSNFNKEEHTNLEKEANFFAANLLLPEKLIRKYINISNSILELSYIFGVSNEFMKNRLKFLGYIH